jgi:hypothetical protein
VRYSRVNPGDSVTALVGTLVKLTEPILRRDHEEALDALKEARVSI